MVFVYKSIKYLCEEGYNTYEDLCKRAGFKQKLIFSIINNKRNLFIINEVFIK